MMSDSDESNCRDDKSQMSYSTFCNLPPPNDGQPYLEIVEQPQSRGFRFRYECEGKSHGGLQGENSRREKKSYPAVRICRYHGSAKIIVSLVTDEKEPKPHAHELIGKNCSNGICTVSIKSDSTVASFPNLGIRHVTKKSVTKILRERLREALKADKMMDGELGQDADRFQLTMDEEKEIERQAESQAKNMPLSVVRLSFRAYLLDHNGMCVRVLPPVISIPIFDSKAPCAALLKICRMDKVGGCCVGNEEVFLLCDKVQKDDITIRFYEQDDEGNVKWEDYGNFAAHDVHRQYAIVFRTPAYVDANIDRPVTVHVQLRRFTDGEVSDPKTFTYYPQQTDIEDIQKKRKKQIPNFSDSDSFNCINNAGFLNLTGILQSGFNGYAEISGLSSLASNGHDQSLGSRASSDHNCVLPLSVATASRLEEDSVDAFSADLVSRGAQPSIKQHVMAQEHMILAHKADRATVQQHDKEKAAFQQSTVKSDSNVVQQETDSSVVQQEADAGTGNTLDSHAVSCESQLINLLHCLADRTAQSIQRYAQTGDSRHLLLPARHLISSPNGDGDNSLHLSVIHSCHTAAVNLLSVLSTLPDCTAINECNDVLQSPLQLAVLTRQPDLVQLLLSHGADPRRVYDQRSGDTLLHTCARHGDDNCLTAILQHWNQSVIHSGSKWLPGIDERNYEGFTALHVAVRGGQLTCAKLLVSIGRADVNASDGRSGRTVLLHAVAANNLAIVGYLLLECSVDIDKPDNTGNTALHYATATNKLGVAALLVAANADADCENVDYDISDDSDNEGLSDAEQSDDMSGKTARDLAAGNPKMLRLLEGESYSSISDRLQHVESATNELKVTNVRFKSFCDSGIESINLHDPDHHRPSSDLAKLDAVNRMKLSKLLDPVQNGSDWRALADKLGFGPISDVFEIQKSPTLVLLDNFELADGSMADLRRGLLEVNRKDAVHLVDTAIPSSIAPVAAPGQTAEP